MHNRFVLDTSALVTLIKSEAGAERVEQVLREAEILLPWVATLEIIYISRRERGEVEALPYK